MSKITIQPPNNLKSLTPCAAFSGTTESSSYFNDGSFSLNLYRHSFELDSTLRLASGNVQCIAFLWQGQARLGEHTLEAGSSFIVNPGVVVELLGQDKLSTLLVFCSQTEQFIRKSDRKGSNPIYLLPRDNVPRYEEGERLSGGLHANSELPDSTIWLHENHFAASSEVQNSNPEKGIHSHSEDEIIFVTDGILHFGTKACHPGTALAIAADAFYSFTPDQNGLGFINFRANRPTDIRFKNGSTLSETGYWKSRVTPPEYLCIDAPETND